MDACREGGGGKGWRSPPGKSNRIIHVEGLFLLKGELFFSFLRASYSMWGDFFLLMGGLFLGLAPLTKISESHAGVGVIICSINRTSRSFVTRMTHLWQPSAWRLYISGLNVLGQFPSHICVYY